LRTGLLISLVVHVVQYSLMRIKKIMRRIFSFFLFLMILSGCMPGNDVRINTSNIFLPILFSIDNKDIDGKTLDLGEFLLTDDPLRLKVRIYNKTDFDYTNLD